MASTIAGTSTNWTITSPAGQLAGAAKNAANASLTDDGTVVIKSADGVLWAGDIMALGGLAGATAALRFTDLLNNFLTGLTASLATTVYARYTDVGAPISTSQATVYFDVLGMAAAAGNYGTVPTYANGVGWTIQKAGIYRITATHRRTFTVATTNLTTLNVDKNGAGNGNINYIIVSTQTGSNMSSQYVNYRTWAVGDVVRIRHTQSAVNNVNHNSWEVVFELISDAVTAPAITSIPTQRFTFNGVEPTYTTGDPDLIIPFDTLQYTGGTTVAVLTSPGVVEIQEDGMYLVSANVTARRTAGATVNDVVPVNINRNGVQDGGRFRATTVDNQRFTLFGTNVLQCNAGDVISFTLPNYTAPPATTYEILNSTNSSGCALSVIKL